jgi:hypothetical protein
LWGFKWGAASGDWFEGGVDCGAFGSQYLELRSWKFEGFMPEMPPSLRFEASYGNEAGEGTEGVDREWADGVFQMNEKKALAIAMVLVMNRAEEWVKKVYMKGEDGLEAKREREKYQELIEVYVVLERMSRAKMF